MPKMSFLSRCACLLVVAIALLQCYGARAVRGNAELAKKFIINLDLPPSDRWTEVTRAHKTDLESLLKQMKMGVPQMLTDAVLEISQNMEKYVPYPYSEEIVGIANNLDNTSVADLLLANLYYELTAYLHYSESQVGVGPVSRGRGYKMACTSIVAEAVNETIMHGRNLDYSLVKFLDSTTITVEFQKGGNTSYTGTTFAGYIGLLTGQKPYKYTVSLDQRNQGQLWMNIVEAWMNGLGAVVSFHIRDALSRDDLSFNDAVAFMTDKALIAPCYIIMGGMESGEGVVITRDRASSADVWRLDVSNGTWYILETNYDHWTTPPASDDRRDPAIKAMDAMTRASLSGVGLYNVLSTPPVFNTGTTYTVIMSAANPEVYSTWIRYDRS